MIIQNLYFQLKEKTLCRLAIYIISFILKYKNINKLKLFLQQKLIVSLDTSIIFFIDQKYYEAFELVLDAFFFLQE